MKSARKVNSWKRMLASLYNRFRAKQAVKRKQQGRALPLIWWQPVREGLMRQQREAWPDQAQRKNGTRLLANGEGRKQKLGKKIQLTKQSTTEAVLILRLRANTTRTTKATTTPKKPPTTTTVKTTTTTTKRAYKEKHWEIPEAPETKPVSASQFFKVRTMLLLMAYLTLFIVIVVSSLTVYMTEKKLFDERQLAMKWVENQKALAVFSEKNIM
ncbi:unnamed protein product [Gongylonema pulchrum]|uniref:Uncharacterized protein n=1 Tax=Gongylonema pulchrum TaxID=637853 RepID=A0A3P6Q3K7_9BILA|nr:unnamed protein product [Gongylonema pulchrum]